MLSRTADFADVRSRGQVRFAPRAQFEQVGVFVAYRGGHIVARRGGRSRESFTFAFEQLIGLCRVAGCIVSDFLSFVVAIAAQCPFERMQIGVRKIPGPQIPVAGLASVPSQYRTARAAFRPAPNT